MRTEEYMPEKTRPAETCKRCTTWPKKKKKKKPNIPKNLTNRPTYVNPTELPNQPCHVPSQNGASTSLSPTPACTVCKFRVALSL